MEDKIQINRETYIKESSLIVNVEDEAKAILLNALKEFTECRMTTPDMLVACARVVEVLTEK